MFDRTSKGLWWDRAWTLVRGCTPVSIACDNCWAAREAHVRRFHQNLKIQLCYSGLTDDDGKWNGKVRTVTANIDLPLRVKKPTAWAVWNDLFHESVPDGFIDRAFATMLLASKHVFLVLTKRPERMRKCLSDSDHWNNEYPSNVWLGVTAENQEQADKRIPILLSIPAARRFASVEPILGPVDLTNYEPLDWVICGGETGRSARPCDPYWVRRLRDDCQAANVPFFFKGWGEWNPNFGEKDSRYFRHTKRLLDGREWNEVEI